MTRRIVGNISFKNNEWVIECEPYVRGKFKRIFPQVKQHAAETLFISHNDENCDDLLWFLDHYPMTISEDDNALLKQCSDRHNQLQVEITNIIESKKSSVNFKIEINPYTYQKTAAELLIAVNGLLLADELGLGKTLSAILAMALPENLPALVVSLAHLPRQIEREINRAIPNLKTHILSKKTPYPLIDEEGNYPDVIISSYAKLSDWAEELAGKIVYVVFDEIQELRTGTGSLKYEACSLVASKAKLRIGLSATPIFNYGAEFYNIIDVLRPNALGTRDEFVREWCSYDSKKIKDTVAFGNFLRNNGLMLLRKRTDPEVQKALPPVSTSIQYVDSDVKIIDKVKGYAFELARLILSETQNFQGERFQASGQFDILMRQATGIAKAPFVAEFVKMIIESGQPVLLFGWHRAVYDIWLKKLAEYNPVMYTSESLVAKERALNAFMKGESQVMIVSLRSGAGLDQLQYHPKCAIGVFGELDWSFGVHEQCQGRLHRHGQTKSLMYYYLLSETGSDPMMADVLGLKKAQLDGVRKTEGDLFTNLQQDKGHIKELAKRFLAENKQTSKTSDFSQDDMDNFIESAGHDASLRIEEEELPW